MEDNKVKVVETLLAMLRRGPHPVVKVMSSTRPLLPSVWV